MMYPFMQLDDGAEIVHSEFLENSTVKVYIEKPDAKDCFHDMTVYLPSYEITSINGFSEEEKNKYMEVVRSTANLIMEFVKNGGFENASSF